MERELLALIAQHEEARQDWRNRGRSEVINRDGGTVDRDQGQT